MVLPAFGGETISARWPKPNGQIKSTTRCGTELREFGPVGELDRWHAIHGRDPAVLECHEVAAPQLRQSHAGVALRGQIAVRGKTQGAAVGGGVEPADERGHSGP